MTEDQLKRTADALSRYEIDTEELFGVFMEFNRHQQKYGNLWVIEHQDGQWGVIDTEGRIIVPFGKYGWIDGFDCGLARVRTHGDSGRVGNIIATVDLEEGKVVEGYKNLQEELLHDRKKNPGRYAKWGIINEEGVEVLPVEYDDVWNFLGKGRHSTIVEKDGNKFQVRFSDLNPSLSCSVQSAPSSFEDSDEGDYFRIEDCYGYDGEFDMDRLEDAYLDGEWVPDDY